jgi:hypothetical protein
MDLDRSKYNQIANYVYMQSEINIKVGNKPPKDYFEVIKTQMQEQQPTSKRTFNRATTFGQLKNELCARQKFKQMSIDDYNDFLTLRRKLMATKIKEYYGWTFIEV